MTELEIIKFLAKNTDTREYPFQIPRAFVYNWECDFFTLSSSGMAREYEIKISRADYFNDAKKAKHIDKTKGANYFYYVCPEGLIKPTEVDKNYGLVYVTKHGPVIAKSPRKLHCNSFDKWEMLAKKMYWKWYTLWRSQLDLGVIDSTQYEQGFEIEDVFKQEQP